MNMVGGKPRPTIFDFGVHSTPYIFLVVSSEMYFPAFAGDIIVGIAIKNK